MVAARSGHVETVVALTEHGADVNLKGQVSCWSYKATPMKCYVSG